MFRLTIVIVMLGILITGSHFPTHDTLVHSNDSNATSIDPDAVAGGWWNWLKEILRHSRDLFPRDFPLPPIF